MNLPKAENSISNIKVGTDCSGFEIPIIALEKSGVSYDHVFSSDMDPHVVKMIEANHSPRILYGDIRNRDVMQVPYVDLYVAGFPCQPFSVAGKKQGFWDEQGRGTLFFDIINYINEKRPKVFILENVRGLATINGGK